MPLRILHSIHSVNPTKGGVIEGLKQLAAVNRQDGHTVELVSMDPPEASWVKECPVVVHAMGPSFLKYGYNRRLVPWIREHRNEYDMIVVNGIWQYNAFGVWVALRRTDTPYFVFTHGMLDPWFKETYPLKHLKKWLYWPWADYRVLRDAKAVLFTCEEERILARRSFWLYRCREEVINYGTSGPKGDPESMRRAFRERFPEIEGKKCLIFMGRMHVKKGPELLIRAFAELLRKRSEAANDLHLIMAGPIDSGYAQALRSETQRMGLGGRVTWTGMVAGDLKWGAIYSSEAFVLPSHQENFGIAVAEALACGVPVLISNKVNIWREIQQDGAGLVQPDDLAGTQCLLEQWVGMGPDARERLREQARACFEQRFHVQRTGGQFVRLLNQYQPRGVG